MNKSCHIKKLKLIKDSNNQLILEEILEEMKQIKEKNKEIEEENKEQKKLILCLQNEIKNKAGDTINSHNTQNITNNINIVAFGEEELETIVSNEICKKILFKGFEAVPCLIEYVHFNKDKPELHNCFISNMRDKYAVTYDGINWNLTDANEVINTLRDDKQIYLENKFEEFYDLLDKTTQKKFNKFIAERDSDLVINRYKESIRLILYNKRGIVIKTKNNQIKKI